jgi:hypothetical protein
LYGYTKKYFFNESTRKSSDLPPFYFKDNEARAKVELYAFDISNIELLLM